MDFNDYTVVTDWAQELVNMLWMNRFFKTDVLAVNYVTGKDLLAVLFIIISSLWDCVLFCNSIPKANRFWSQRNNDQSNVWHRAGNLSLHLWGSGFTAQVTALMVVRPEALLCCADLFSNITSVLILKKFDANAIIPVFFILINVIQIGMNQMHTYSQTYF